MKNGTSNEHLSAERIQAFLDGELPGRERAQVEEHLTGCAHCSAEYDAWCLMFEDLEGLESPRPHQGFADRVMADVQIPRPLPLAARVRRRLAEALPAPVVGHIEGAILQDFLDGVVGQRQRVGVESHLAECATCSAEADSWFALLRRLEDLEHFGPREGFADRVIAEVRMPETLGIAARVRASLGALLATSPRQHVEAGRLQDFLEGILPAHHMARVRAHVGGCAKCSAEVEGWRTLLTRLEGLDRLVPGQHLAERVMAGVRIPASSPAVAGAPVWAQALAYAQRLVPRTRRTWAAISGVAVTPAVTAGLVFYAVFSHPTLTLEALASFVWWQVTDLATLGWTTLSGAVLESAQLFDAYSLVETVASQPLAVAGALLAYSVVSALALRVLYMNLIVNRPLEGRYAHVSAS